jgi:hypothetical protein
MMLQLLLMAAATGLTNPPMQITWATAGMQVGDEAADGAAPCEIEHADVLVVIAQQTATDGMTREQRDAYDAILERIEDGYEEADRRGRLQMLLDLHLASNGSIRILSRGWVVLDDMQVAIVYVHDLRSGRFLFTVEDEVTGASASFSSGPIDEESYGANSQRVAEILDAEDTAEQMRIARDIAREPTVTEDRFEVNGQVMTVTSDGAEDWAARTMAFVKLWPSMAPDDGRRRVEQALAVLFAMIDDSDGAFLEISRHRIWPEAVNPDSVGTDACLEARGIRFVDGRRSQGGVLNYAPVPDDVVEAFFGDDPLPMPDPGLSWKQLMKQLR